MSSLDYKELVISCPSWQKAQALADELLQQSAVKSVEFMEAQDQARQYAKPANITLVVQTLADDFQTITSKVIDFQTEYDRVLLRGV